ncbi:MAG: DUF6356 family protein [Pseudomonadota bacterium]
MKWFTAHPDSVGESYWQHCGVALGFAGALAAAALAALVHALLPWAFERTASEAISRLHEQLQRRH